MYLGFRPAFRYYSHWLSLLAAVMCVAIMFVMSWPTTILTLLFFLTVYAFIKRLKPGLYSVTVISHCLRDGL